MDTPDSGAQHTLKHATNTELALLFGCTFGWCALSGILEPKNSGLIRN